MKLFCLGSRLGVGGEGGNHPRLSLMLLPFNPYTDPERDVIQPRFSGEILEAQEVECVARSHPGPAGEPCCSLHTKLQSCLLKVDKLQNKVFSFPWP